MKRNRLKYSLMIAGCFFVPFSAFSENSNTPKSYIGSSFNEVKEVLINDDLDPLNRIEDKEINSYKFSNKPHYWVNSSTFYKKEDGKKINQLEIDSKRTIAEQFDYYDRLKKLLHPNGICFTGSWEITQNTDYTGYFEKGKKALLVARASVTLSNTKSGYKRGFAFAGKLFPTNEPEKTVKTGNFFLVDVLAGTKAPHYLDVAMTNQPKSGFDFYTAFIGFHAARALAKADVNPSFRPLYPISELNLAEGQQAKTPKWMMIKAAADMNVVDKEDFRDELNIENYQGGLNFNIYVSDTTNDTQSDQWQAIGLIHLNESMVSYGCDRRLHFAHPKMK